MKSQIEVVAIQTLTKQLEEKRRQINDTNSSSVYTTPKSVLSREIYDIKVRREQKIKEIRSSFKIVKETP